MCSINSVDPMQLKIGTEIELEHTRSRRKARQIALTHLCESPRYYVPGNVRKEHLVINRREYRRLMRKAHRR